MTTLRNVADDLATAVAANVTAELTIALLSESQTDIGVRAWPDLTRNGAALRIAAMMRGERLTLDNIGTLSAALGLDCDDLTSTWTTAARETRSRPAADDGDPT